MQQHKIKSVLRTLSVCLVLCLVVAMTPADASAFTISQLRASTAVTTITSGSTDSANYLKLTTEDSKINVVFKHSQKFDRIVLRLMKAGTGTSAKLDKYYDTQVAAGKTFQQAYDFSEVPSGEYYFRIVTQKDANTDAGLTNYPSYMHGVYVVVEDGIPTMYKFSNIATSNKNLTKSVARKFYKQKSLKDLQYQLFAKKGSSSLRTINATTEAKYYKTVSDSIVASTDSNYTKLQKIFTYVAKNFYYDHYGVATGKQAYDDPYYNLKYLRNKTGNSYNAYSGKVALQCDGYAGIFTALTRAQGIPCRIVYGRKITSGGSYTWESVPSSYFKNNSHTWAEAYVGGRWITVDPQQGSYNSYGLSGNKTDKTWRKSTLVNYTFFDMSKDFLAYSHYGRTLPGGETSVSLMDSDEAAQMKTFLNKKSSGKTNGKRLNSNYSATKKSTWSNNNAFYTDGFGYVKYINWPEKNLVGTLNVSNYTELTNLTVYLNNLSGLNTKGCSSLETVYASGNNIKTVNLLAAKSLKKADYKNNPLTKAQLYIKGKSITVQAKANGTFSFKYNKSNSKKLTIYPKANIGYKYIGLYNASGKKVSSNKTSYTFTPTSKTYTAKYALDPTSFKYYLKAGNKSTLYPYNTAVQKRLKALGYYKSSSFGKYTSTTTAAVKAFQKKHGLKQVGNVDETTWKKLFSTKAKAK